MQSSPGVYSSRVPPELWIASIPCAALVLALALSFGSAMSMRENVITVPPANVAPRFSHTSPEKSGSAGAEQAAGTSTLWKSLEPLAIDIDTAAVLGLTIVGAVLLLRRRPKAQT